MVKIKQKKQINLPQLIEWLLKSGYRNYTANSNMGNTVTLSRYGAIQFSPGTFFPEETFTVEVEEVVDEDTKLSKSLAIFEHNGNLYSEMHDNKNINNILKMDIKVKSSSTKTIHMVNDDGTHTLIWRDGKLVE